MTMNRRNETRFPVAALILLLATSCSDQPSPPDGHDAVRNEAASSDGKRADVATAYAKNNATESATPAMPAADEVPLLSSVSRLEQDDPLADGWRSEAFNNAASAQLKRLGDWILGNQPTPDGQPGPKRQDIDLAEIALPEATGDRLGPASCRVVYDDELVHITRAEVREPSVGHEADTVRDAGDGDASVVRLATAMESLRQCLTAYPQDRRFKFKLFRVTFDKHDSHCATTTQYAQFSGRADAKSRELNATWTIQWRFDADKPKIESIRLNRFEQVTLNARRLFRDCTESALGSNPSYREALVPSVPYWRRRFERQIGVYDYGHHGIAIGDVNGDGREDLYVCQTGGLPNHMYIQRTDGTLSDVSAASKTNYFDNTRSALLLDLDNDDDEDLVLALTTGLVFLENDGQARFQLRARIPSVRQAFSLAAADYDQDGNVDLYICVYYGHGDEISELPVPVPYFDATNGGGNYLIRNQGDWRFTDVTEQVGLNDDNQRFSYAAVWDDYDNDGDSDLFVVNDYGPNHLYRNQRGQFRNVAPNVGLVDGAFGMSATLGDYDRDGTIDLYVSNMFSAAGNRVTFQPGFKPTTDDSTKWRFRHLARGNSLFRGGSDGRFTDVSAIENVTMGRWSWGSLFADINNDGWDDLLVANGFVTGTSKDDL